MFLFRRVIITRLGSLWCVSNPIKSFAFDSVHKVLASESVLMFDTVCRNYLLLEISPTKFYKIFQAMLHILTKKSMYRK